MAKFKFEIGQIVKHAAAGIMATNLLIIARGEMQFSDGSKTNVYVVSYQLGDFTAPSGSLHGQAYISEFELSKTEKDEI